VERVHRRLSRLVTPAAAPYWQIAPLAGVFAVFFLLPLAITVIVSFWRYTEYSMIPAMVGDNYVSIFVGCLAELPGLCVTFKTYLSTLKFCVLVWLVTLVLGFTVAYFLAFHVRSLTWQIVLFLLCTIPFWTSNVIRMISWVPLLGRNGLVNAIVVGSGWRPGLSSGCYSRTSPSCWRSCTSTRCS
jgi:putative spermidine/putrescine transport system permease protein